MKVLFGVNITDNSKNEKEDGECFIVRKVPESLIDDYEPDENEPKEDKAKQWKVKIFNIFAVCVLGAGLLGLSIPFDDESLSAAIIKDKIAESPLWFVISAVIAVLGVLLVIKGNRMENTYYEINEKEAEEEIDELDRKCYEFLGVPEGAYSFEVLSLCYKTEQGQVVFEQNSAIGFSNPELKAFTDRGYLYLADTESLYEIRPDTLGEIQKHNGKISILCWHKNIKYNKGEFQKYNIRKKGLLKYTMDTYYSYNFAVNGELYKMYFPPYELETVLKATGAKLI